MTPAQEDDVVRMCSRKPAAAPADADNDGMPDAWEKAHGLDPRSADADRKMPSGYTAIEEYVNQLADKLIEAAARAPRRPPAATRRAASASE